MNRVCACVYRHASRKRNKGFLRGSLDPPGRNVRGLVSPLYFHLCRSVSLSDCSGFMERLVERFIERSPFGARFISEWREILKKPSNSYIYERIILQDTPSTSAVLRRFSSDEKFLAPIVFQVFEKSEKYVKDICNWILIEFSCI